MEENLYMKITMIKLNLRFNCQLARLRNPDAGKCDYEIDFRSWIRVPFPLEPSIGLDTYKIASDYIESLLSPVGHFTWYYI